MSSLPYSVMNIYMIPLDQNCYQLQVYAAVTCSRCVQINSKIIFSSSLQSIIEKRNNYVGETGAAYVEEIEFTG